jgi:hypothetical protein
VDVSRMLRLADVDFASIGEVTRLCQRNMAAVRPCD